MLNEWMDEIFKRKTFRINTGVYEKALVNHYLPIVGVSKTINHRDFGLIFLGPLHKDVQVVHC